MSTPGTGSKTGGGPAIYVGAGQQALDFTVDFRKTRRFEPDPEPGSHKLVVQPRVAEMSMAGSARLMLYQPASRWADADAVSARSGPARAEAPGDAWHACEARQGIELR